MKQKYTKKGITLNSGNIEQVFKGAIKILRKNVSRDFLIPRESFISILMMEKGLNRIDAKKYIDENHHSI